MSALMHESYTATGLLMHGLAASGISAGELSAYIAILVFLLTIAGGVVTYLIRRRGTTGTVNTSEAAVLWDQAQKMRSELTEQLDRVTAQRDRVIESQSAQVLPVLKLINESLGQITQSLARLEERQGPL